MHADSVSLSCRCRWFSELNSAVQVCTATLQASVFAPRAECPAQEQQPAAPQYGMWDGVPTKLWELVMLSLGTIKRGGAPAPQVHGLFCTLRSPEPHRSSAVWQLAGVKKNSRRRSEWILRVRDSVMFMKGPDVPSADEAEPSEVFENQTYYGFFW